MERLGVSLAEVGRVESARLMCRLNFPHTFALSCVEEFRHAAVAVKVSIVMIAIVSRSVMLGLYKLTEGGIEGRADPVFMGETFA